MNGRDFASPVEFAEEEFVWLFDVFEFNVPQVQEKFGGAGAMRQLHQDVQVVTAIGEGGRHAHRFHLQVSDTLAGPGRGDRRKLLAQAVVRGLLLCISCLESRSGH